MNFIPFVIERKFHKHYTTIILFLIFSHLTYSQESHLEPINFLNIGFTKGEIPKDLLQKRTIGIVFSTKEKQGKVILWKEIASLSHPIITQLGIDIVCWYNANEIMISEDIRIILSDILINREIDYILLFFYENEKLTLHITKFNKYFTLLDKGQMSWSISDEKIDVILSTLKKSIVQRQLVKTNLLISDFPEFHSLLDMPRNKKFQDNIRLFYESNLKTSILAVNIPPFKNSGSSSFNDHKSDSLKFATIMSNYPYEYKIVSTEVQDSELVERKILYRLFWVYGQSKKIIETYNIDTLKWNSVKGLETKIPLDEGYYYKAMVKNMYSEKIMSGDKWDGGRTISDALENFFNLKKDK